MQPGVGIDIVEIERMNRLESEPGLSESLFTARERRYCDSQRYPHSHYAVRFAAKEAFLKASGIALHTGTRFSDIELVNDIPGQPTIALHGELAKGTGDLARFHVAVSCSRRLACAVVALE